MEYVIDPDEAAHALTDANGIKVLAPVKSVPAPSEKIWASNVDSEGELPAGATRGNSEHTLQLRLVGSSEEEFRQRQAELDQKLHKLDTEGGILRVIYPDTSYIDWEVRAVNVGERLLDNRFTHHWRTQDEVTFVCGPFGEEAEELLGEFEGEAQRVLECIIEDVGGSAPALGRAVVISPDTDIWNLKYGRDSRRYSPADTAKAFYGVTDLTPLGGAIATTATIAGQAETPVVRHTSLSPNSVAVLSTDIATAGKLTHEGIFDVIVWVHIPEGNSGDVTLAFEYGVTGARRTELEPVTLEAGQREGEVLQLSLGHAFLRSAQQGSHSWDGRVLVRSTVTGDGVDLLGDLCLRPLVEASGEVALAPRLAQPSALVVHDEFDQAEGNLHGQGIASTIDSVGPVSPSSVSNDSSVGDKAWGTPEEAKEDGGSKAQVHLVDGEDSHYLKAKTFDLSSIPEGAVIAGIELHVEKNRSSNNYARDKRVHVVKGGVIKTGVNKASSADWPYSNNVITTYGSPSDLWGQSWSLADVEGIQFVFQAEAVGGQTNCNVDFMSVTVHFSDASGNLWSTTGDATDLVVEDSGHTAQRTQVSDAENIGRYAIVGDTELTDMVVGIKAKRTSVTATPNNEIHQGVLARYTDTENWLMARFNDDVGEAPGSYQARVLKRVSGTVSTLASVTVIQSFDWRHIWLHVDRQGRWFCWASLIDGGAPQLLAAGQDAELAEGGALAEGKAGFYDAKIGAAACTRNYDNFVVWEPSIDAAIFTGQSLELRHNAAEREAADGGGAWGPITLRGDYLKFSPAGKEDRSNRLVFVASPNDPDTMGVGFPGDLKVAVYGKRRHRMIPDPA